MRLHWIVSGCRRGFRVTMTRPGQMVRPPYAIKQRKRYIESLIKAAFRKKSAIYGMGFEYLFHSYLEAMP